MCPEKLFLFIQDFYFFYYKTFISFDAFHLKLIGLPHRVQALRNFFVNFASFTRDRILTN